MAQLLLWMTLAYVAASILAYFQAYVMAGAAQQAVRDLRSDLFVHMQAPSLRFFDQRAQGELMSRVSNDIENINNVLNESVTQLIASVLSMAGIAAVMLWVNPGLAAVTLVVVPLMTLGITRVIGKRTRTGFRQQQANLGTLNGLIEETISGQRVVKAYAQEQTAIDEFDVANQELRRAATRAQIFAGFMGPVMGAVNNISLAMVVGVGSLMALQGLATVGTIAAFINYSRQFGRPLGQIANLYNSIQSAIAGAERVFQIIDEAPELTDAPDALPLAGINGEVVFQDVSFGYDRDLPVLKNVCVHAKPGQVIALVGPTGAGKTTIVNLLTRFYDVDQGRILIDGHDIRQVKQDDLRRQLGIVLQETFLFAETMMENIRYGRHDDRGTEKDLLGIPLDRYFSDAEVVYMRGSWKDPNSSWVGFAATDNWDFIHGQLDQGTFVFDALGQRWATDFGADNYGLPGYWDKDTGGIRWKAYRIRAEGHNTLVINPGSTHEDQQPMAKGKMIDFSAGGDHPFAIADLTDAYKQNGALRVRRGVKLLDRSALLICDELTLENPSEVWWFMHTEAEIAVAADGRSATLRQGGKQIEAVLLNAPDGAELIVMDAERLPSSPGPTPGELGAKGYRKLAIKMEGVTDVHLAVALVPEGGQAVEKPVSPLSSWGS